MLSVGQAVPRCAGLGFSFSFSPTMRRFGVGFSPRLHTLGATAARASALGAGEPRDYSPLDCWRSTCPVQYRLSKPADDTDDNGAEDGLLSFG